MAASIQRLCRLQDALADDGARCAAKGLGLNRAGRVSEQACRRLFDLRLTQLGRKYLDSVDVDDLFNETWMAAFEDERAEYHAEIRAGSLCPWR